MRLDHLLSREKARMETSKLIPRSIPLVATQTVQNRDESPKTAGVLPFFCIVFRVREGLEQAQNGQPFPQLPPGSLSKREAKRVREEGAG